MASDKEQYESNGFTQVPRADRMIPVETVSVVDAPRPDEPETELDVKLKDTGKRDYYHRHPSGVACIDIIEHMPLNVGTAMKYLWRCDEKHPDPIEDLKKAQWYVAREIQRRAAMLRTKESDHADQTRP